MPNLKVCKNGWLTPKYNNNGNAFWVAKMGGTPWGKNQPQRVGVKGWVTNNPPTHIVNALFGTGTMQPLPSIKVCKNGYLRRYYPHYIQLPVCGWCLRPLQAHTRRVRNQHQPPTGKWAKG